MIIYDPYLYGKIAVNSWYLLFMSRSFIKSLRAYLGVLIALKSERFHKNLFKNRFYTGPLLSIKTGHIIHQLVLRSWYRGPLK